MSSIEFLRSKVNGIEFYTHPSTGESGLNTSGVGKSLGVSRQAITLLIEFVSNSDASKDLPECLQPLWGKELQLQATYKNAKILSSDTWACFAEYYAFESKQKTRKALQTYRSFGIIGATSYIQGVTGWLPIALQSSQESRTALDRILDDAKPYKVFYEPLLYKKAIELMGVGFYWHYCYDFLTLTERCKLNLVNEQTPNGRINYIHQHISPDTLPRLEKYLIQLAVLVNQALDRQDFDAMYQLEFFGNRQLKMKLQINPNTGK